MIDPHLAATDNAAARVDSARCLPRVGVRADRPSPVGAAHIGASQRLLRRNLCPVHHVTLTCEHGHMISAARHRAGRHAARRPGSLTCRQEMTGVD